MPNLVPGPGKPILPGPDEDFLAFATNFSTIWDPTTFQSEAPGTGNITGAANAFQNALSIATDPATRTTATIATKDARRKSLENLLLAAIRVAVAAFRRGSATSADLLLLNIRVPKTVPTPIAAPVYAPLLGVQGARPGFAELRVTHVVDGQAVNTRSFPYGCTGVEISRSTGTSWTSLGIRRRVNLLMDTSDLVNGTIASYRVRYVTARGLAGPWSDSIMVPVVNGA